MNSKASWALLLLVVLAALFAPIIPNDSIADCIEDDTVACDKVDAYVSVYSKYIK